MMVCRECGSNIEEEGYCILCDHFLRAQPIEELDPKPEQ